MPGPLATVSSESVRSSIPPRDGTSDCHPGGEQTALAETSSPRSRRKDETNSVEFLTAKNDEIGDEGRPGA
ncbi:MAG: hypothetical protein HY812_21910 [Planctomycetes bacterium]|nr:hypothetical protein [Planctomycetota bacterium]